MASVAPKLAFYPGSFDPLTLGHLDIIKRAAELFDSVLVGVGHSDSKSYLFTAEERQQMIVDSCRDIANISVESYEGLTVDFAVKNNINVLIRGLRTHVDYAYEQQMFEMNKTLSAKVDTIYFPTAKEYSHLSSTLVREVARYDGVLEGMVPLAVLRKLRSK